VLPAVRAAAALVAFALVAVVAAPADASQGDLARAQAEANRAARAYADAQTHQAEIQAEIANLSARTSETEKRLSALSAAVRERAVQQYIRGTDGNVKLDTDLAASTRANALARFVSLGNDDAIDKYRSAAEDLHVLRGQLQSAREDASATAKRLRATVNAAFAELKKLQALDAERKAAEAAKRAAAARRSNTSTRRSGPSFIAGNGSWMCPVQGPHSFSNDYGAPRGGGSRRHQGVDILSPRGTPVVANVSGSVRRHDNGLGGISYYLEGVDGNEYYGAHLQAYAGRTGQVPQGTVIGYVGNSGDARGGPTHLHFEIHPGGGGSVNPYPTLRQYC
jgi:murein DD-endopeptidase MepM/ murein hydrolase activator NlpD